MASSKEYLNFILEQISALGEVTYKSMMGEYMLYYQGKLIAYICDDRLLIKPVKTAVKLLPEASYEPPYEGAKDMILVEEVDNREFLVELFRAIYDELPALKKKK